MAWNDLIVKVGMDSSGFSSGTMAVKRSVDGLKQGMVALSRTITDQKSKLAELGRNNKGASTQYKQLKAEIRANEGQLRSMNNELRNTVAATGGGTSAFSKFGASIKSLAGAAIGIGGVTGVIMGVKAAAETVFNFEQAVADLGAISNASSSDLEALANKAREVAKTSAYTATQVVNLQTELSKLGFSVPEIAGLSKSVVNLSTALGADASEAATILGGQLRAFGADASQAAKFAEILGATANMSAVDFDDFAMMLPKVSTAAAQTGWDFAQLNATLGILRDRNIRAESAGTSLRNILLKTSDTAGGYDKALAEIAGSTNKLSTATKIFGTENAVVAVVLSETMEATKASAEEIRNMSGVLAEMNRKKLDTVKGQVLLLKSAWEELTLSIAGSGGAIKQTIRFATDAVAMISQLIKYGSLYGKEFDKNQSARSSDVDRHISANLERIKSDSTYVDTFKKNMSELILAKRLAIGKLEGQQGFFVDKDLEKQIANAKNQLQGLLDIEKGVASGLNSAGKIEDKTPGSGSLGGGKIDYKGQMPKVEITPFIDSARLTTVIDGLKTELYSSDVARIGYGSGIQYMTFFQEGIASKPVEIAPVTSSFVEKLKIAEQLEQDYELAAKHAQAFGANYDLIGQQISATSAAITAALSIDNIDSTYIDELVAKYNLLINKQKEITEEQQKMADRNQRVADMMGIVSEAATTSFAAIATGSKNAGDAVADFAKTAVKAILKFVQAELLAAAASQIKDGSSKYGWYGLVIAAGAIAGIYSMIDSAGSKAKGVKLAKGGVAFGETQATIGDNPNARFDPEVVAPLSKLEMIMDKRGGSNLTGTFVVKGPDLVLVLDNAQRYMGKARK